MKQKIKLIIVLAVEFIAISIVLLLIFLAGKKSYTVTFDLNGGILLSGELEQRVTQGQNATPPSAAKDGHYLRGWSGNYKKVTHDSTVRAIWEYETSPGIVYSDAENQNFCEIIGSFKELRGEVYIGAYHDDKIVLGITDGAFKDRSGITAIYLLDGILSIGDEAFAGCESLETIDIPSTVVTIGKDAFKGCKNLKSITLPEGLETIKDGAFSGCESLEEVTIPWNVTKIGIAAFDSPGLTVIIYTEAPKDDDATDEESKEEDEGGENDENGENAPENEETVRDFAEGWYTDDVTLKEINPNDKDSDSSDDTTDPDGENKARRKS